MAKNDTKPKDDTTPAVEEEQNAEQRPDEGIGPYAGTEGAETDVEQSSNAPATEEVPFVGTHVVNTARGLNLREAPSYGSPVVEILPFGTAVQDVDPAGAPAGWLHVMTEAGKAGFVAERYVSAIAAEE